MPGFGLRNLGLEGKKAKSKCSNDEQVWYVYPETGEPIKGVTALFHTPHRCEG